MSKRQRQPKEEVVVKPVKSKAHGGPVIQLRRDGPVAMHRQMTEQLREAIRDGTYKQGERIPAEPELAARYEVSRITARQAVMQLVREGLVVRRQGKGTFVSAATVQHDLLGLRGIYAELGGNLHVNGSARAPQVTGGFELLRGSLMLHPPPPARRTSQRS